MLTLWPAGRGAVPVSTLQCKDTMPLRRVTVFVCGGRHFLRFKKLPFNAGFGMVENMSDIFWNMCLVFLNMSDLIFFTRQEEFFKWKFLFAKNGSVPHICGKACKMCRRTSTVRHAHLFYDWKSPDFLAERNSLCKFAVVLQNCTNRKRMFSVFSALTFHLFRASHRI